MFHYFDSRRLYAYSLQGEVAPGTALPDNAMLTSPRFGDDGQPLLGEWPIANGAGNGWEYTEDHRKRYNAQGQKIPDSGTAYWLPGDTYQTPARYMDTPGPLPEGALLSQPEMTQAEKDEQRKQEIMARLTGIDFESIRPLRAITDGKATDLDHAKLAQLDTEATDLRAELAHLAV